MTPLIHSLGDSAVTVAWPDISDTEAAERVERLCELLRAQWHGGYESLVPAFASLTIHYSPLVLSWSQVLNHLEELLNADSLTVPRKLKRVEIPVCYADEFAPDLAELAAGHGLPVEDVIRIHSSAEYRVRMIGFSPGFPYLAGLPETLATPRRSTPRLKVPAGSVAIGGRQTGIYSLETPGGWHIIGRTPLAMFRPDLSPPCLLSAGDEVRFVRLSREQFYDESAV